MLPPRSAAPFVPIRLRPIFLSGRLTLRILIGLAGGLALTRLPAQAEGAGIPHANRPLQAVRVPAESQPPVIDGDLSDPIWKTAAKADLFFDPQSGKPVDDQTEAFLAYDKQYIYVAFHCRDVRPDAIMARETVRDAYLGDDDNVQVEFDPFLTYKYEDYAVFQVNACGTHRTRLGGGRAGKLEWQGDWVAAARRTADGYSVEMRIPWRILSYPNRPGALTMGVNFRRYQQRTHLMSLWSDLGPQYFNEREGLWQGVETPMQAWRPRFSMLPYLMPSGRASGGNSQVRFGIDARYQPTPELTGVATLNPDFASVEGAVEGIGFTRSERFVPDRRPFFFEGQNYLNLGEDYQLGLLFDSARIQQLDTGVKLYGKVTPQTTLGMLGTIGLGRETDFVTLLRREFGPTSSTRFLLMQRLEPGADNTVMAIAPEFRRGKWSVDGQVIQTLGPQAGGRGYTAALNLSDKNLFSTVRYLAVGANFNDRLGYVPFTDFRGWSSYTDWNAEWRHGFFRNFDVSFSPNWDWHTDGRPFRRRASLSLNLTTRSDYQVGAYVDGGKFDADNDLTYGLSLGGGVSNRFRRWNLYFTTGRQANRPYTSFGPSFRVRLFKKFDLSFSSFVENFDQISQQHILTFNYELSPYRAWGGRAVIENGNVNVYFSFRNAGRAGTDTYLIVGDPNARRLTKQVMMKFVFAL